MKQTKEDQTIAKKYTLINEIAFREPIEPDLPEEDADVKAAKTHILNLALAAGKDVEIKLGPNMFGGGVVNVLMVTTPGGNRYTIQQINTMLDYCENIEQVIEVGEFLGLLKKGQA